MIKIWTWAVKEVHSGNFMPFVFAGLLWFFVLLPMYNMVDSKFMALFSVSEYVVTDNEAIKKELEDLKRQVARNMSSRKAGKVGLTYH